MLPLAASLLQIQPFPFRRAEFARLLHLIPVLVIHFCHIIVLKAMYVFSMRGPFYYGAVMVL